MSRCTGQNQNGLCDCPADKEPFVPEGLGEETDSLQNIYILEAAIMFHIENLLVPWQGYHACPEGEIGP